MSLAQYFDEIVMKVWTRLCASGHREAVRLSLSARYPGPRGIDRLGYTDREIMEALNRFHNVLIRWQRRYGTRHGFPPTQDLFYDTLRM